MKVKPKVKKQGLKFWPIPEVKDYEQAFGLENKHYFDRYNLPEVPSKYEQKVSQLFFRGGDLPKLQKEVELDKAVPFLRALLASFAPAHESKIATAAYALWVWSEAELN